MVVSDFSGPKSLLKIGRIKNIFVVILSLTGKCKDWARPEIGAVLISLVFLMFYFLI